MAVDALGCAFTPPPRFIYAGPAEGSDIGTWYQFDRVLFTGSEGIDRLLLLESRERVDVGDAQALSRRAAALARSIHVSADVQGVEVRGEPVAELGSRPCVFVVVEGQGHLGRIRSVMGWFLDEGARLWCMSIATTTAQPKDVLTRELQAAIESWRRTRPAASRPWWRFWAR